MSLAELSSSFVSLQNANATFATMHTSAVVFEQKSPAYVIGERVVRPAIDYIGSLLSWVYEGGTNFYTTLSGKISFPAFQTSSHQAETCFSHIVGQYPTLSDSEKQVVRDICNNQRTSLTIDGDMSTVGIQAMSEALKSNTVLTHLDLGSCGTGGEHDDPTTSMIALSNALKINRTLKILVIDHCFLNSSAYEVLFENLPCFNLETFALDFDDTLDASSVIALADSIANNRFPLSNLTITEGTFGDAIVREVARGISNTPCIQSLVMKDMFSSYSAEALEQLLVAMAESKSLMHLKIGSDDSSDWPMLNETKVLESVETNPCLISFEVDPIFNGYFPEDLLEKINNLIAGRSRCTQDPSCEKPKTCSIPQSSSSGSKGKLGIILGPIFGVAGIIGIFLAIAKRRNLNREEERTSLLRGET